MLGTLALVICIAAGIPLGILSAVGKGRLQDYAVMLFATLGTAVPGFILAAFAHHYLCVRLGIFPVMGFSSFRHMILPALILSVFPISFVARLMRSSMLEVLQQDYIRAARARGLSEAAVLYRHALKNALLPVVTLMGPLTAGMFTGWGTGGSTADKPVTGTDVENSLEEISDRNVVRAVVGPEPRTIDPALNTASDTAIYIMHAFEGLARVDRQGQNALDA